MKCKESSIRSNSITLTRLVETFVAGLQSMNTKDTSISSIWTKRKLTLNVSLFRFCLMDSMKKHRFSFVRLKWENEKTLRNRTNRLSKDESYLRCFYYLTFFRPTNQISTLIVSNQSNVLFRKVFSCFVEFLNWFRLLLLLNFFQSFDFITELFHQQIALVQFRRQFFFFRSVIVDRLERFERFSHFLSEPSSISYVVQFFVFCY